MVEQDRQPATGATRRFAAMVATYALGVFNDNFFKQAACLIAIVVGRDEFQGYAAAVFCLPWLLFAAPAGWMADRFSKRTVVISAKALELVAMGAGAAGILMVNWPLIFVMLFLMALQSTIFSPALNGSIPELYPADYVVKANSTIKTITTSSILVGIILAGIALGQKADWMPGVTLGRTIVAAGVVAVALAGLLMSFGVPKRPAADPGAPFPWTGPVETVRLLWRTRQDRLLATAIAVDAFVWFVAVVQILVINKLGMAQFEIGEAWTSYLVTAELGGVAIGGLLARRLAAGRRWWRVLTPGLLLLAGAMVLVAGVPWLPAGMQLPAVVVLLVLVGIPGGVLLVPLESFFQIRPAPERKGAVIAAANFAAFFAMMLAGFAANALNAWITPTTSFAVLGGVTLIVAAALPRVLPEGDLP